ncbi:MAG: PDZ domain-containing protein [Oscillospiraceae bacterium]|nr:PDZ domain-containing protein [Oscillospiraceae bacterium]
MKLKKTAAVFLFAMLTAAPALAAELPKELVPMGEVVGISIKTEGVEISELSYIETEDGSYSPAGNAGMKAGDVIIEAGGKKIETVADIALALREQGGRELRVKFKRNGSTLSAVVKPIVRDGTALLGIWAKDGINGIGTITFYDPESDVFGALGHPVSEDTGDFCDGSIHPAVISGVVPGKAGAPGQLGGSIDLSENNGEITTNSQAGIFGLLKESPALSQCPIPVASRSEIREGDAIILSAASGAVKQYSVKIESVYTKSEDMRSMLIRVTDSELMALTGGIVQGMSGSPIIQDGKLIGAVTHVLVADPTKGYGIAIDDMLSECRNAGLYDKAA